VSAPGEGPRQVRLRGKYGVAIAGSPPLRNAGPRVDRLASIGNPADVPLPFYNPARSLLLARLVSATLAILATFALRLALGSDAEAEEPGCAGGCPCAAASAADDDDADAIALVGDATSAPCDDGEHNDCPEGCAHCSCCPALTVAALPTPLSPAGPPALAPDAAQSAGSLLLGVPARIFRPPQPALS
jgi:hypothetical protein